MVIRRSVLLSVLVLAAVGLTACNSGNAGTPTPASATTTDGSGGSTSPSSGDGLASIDPCGLLSEQDVSQLGLAKVGPDNDSESRGCKWTKNGAYAVAFFIYEHRGIQQVGTDGVTKANVPSHDAVQSTASGVGCDLEIAVTNSSSTDVIVSSTGNDGQECAIAQQYATIIEPKLPAQQK